jgi:hypothetical protein
MAAVPPATLQRANTSGPNPLTIGGLTLASIDCPSELAIGTGEQKRSVQTPIGGGKVVHLNGFVPDLNTWKGVLHQPDIATNVATLRRFAVDGKERLCSWSGEMYYGIVVRFHPNYRKGGNVCDWQIDMEITRAANGAFSPTAPQASVDERIGTLSDTVNVSTDAINAAAASQSATVQAMNADLQLSVKNATLALGDASPTATASPSAMAQALAAVSSALGKANAIVTALPVGGAGYLSASQMVAALSTIVGVLQATQVQAVHQQQGGSLFELAATKYGDLSRAYDLMRTNGISAPVLSEALYDIALLPYPTT